MLDTTQYPHLYQGRTRLSKAQEQESWLLNRQDPADRVKQVLVSIEDTLSKLANYPGYEKAILNLLRSRTWDEYQEHWWMLKVAHHLAHRDLLRQIEVDLPNGSRPDIRAEAILEGRVVTFYVEAKSWRFHPSLEIFSSDSGLALDKRVERMKAKLLKQLPEDSLGVWAWDKMRDGISGSYTLGSAVPNLGTEENRVICEMCAGVPQLAAVMVKILDKGGDVTVMAVPNPVSKWSRSCVDQLVTILNQR